MQFDEKGLKRKKSMNSSFGSKEREKKQRETESERVNIVLDIWNLIFILSSFHLPFYCMVWKCFKLFHTCTPLPPHFHKGRSFIPFVLSIYHTQLHFLLLSFICVSSKLQIEKANCLEWWVLHKRIAMTLFIHPYVSSDLTFLMMRNSNFDLCMHEMCMWWIHRVSERSRNCMKSMRFRLDSHFIFTIFNEFTDIFICISEY